MVSSLCIILFASAAFASSPTELSRFFAMNAAPCAEELGQVMPKVDLERVILRRFEPSDETEVVGLLQDEDLTRAFFDRRWTFAKGGRAYIDYGLEPAFDEEQLYGRGLVRKFRFVVELKSSGRVVGLGMLQRAPQHRGVWAIGYAIGRAHRRLGLATEVVRGLLALATEIDPRAVVEAKLWIHNHASRGVITPLGFREAERIDAEFTTWRWRVVDQGR